MWDATSGTIHSLAGFPKATGSVDVPLAMGPQEAKFVVIGTLPAGARALPLTTKGDLKLIAVDGEWLVTFGDKQSSTPLKSWEALDAESFTGTAEYRKTFDATVPQGQRAYLDLGSVNEVARVRMNGKELEARGWGPYVWDVTESIRSGPNTVEVQVQMAVIGGRGGGGGRAGRGGANAPPATPAARGLLGPVRLIVQ
jgi:hypothetical protein